MCSFVVIPLQKACASEGCSRLLQCHQVPNGPSDNEGGECRELTLINLDTKVYLEVEIILHYIWHCNIYLVGILVEIFLCVLPLTYTLCVLLYSTVDVTFTNHERHFGNT